MVYRPGKKSAEVTAPGGSWAPTFRRRAPAVHTVAVVGVANPSTAPQEIEDNYVKVLEASGVEVADVEILPCTGTVCTQSITPDTATIAKVSVALGARGSTKIQTLPALSIDEFVQTIQ